MKIRFIDLKTGNTYNGLSPYIHWFNGGQSVNINYVQHIAIISDAKNLTFTCESPFVLYDASEFPRATRETIYDNEYVNINSITTMQLQSTGEVYDADQFVHILYVGVRSDEAREYIGNITIESGGITKTMCVGADMYNEDEELGINLGNIGIDIPTVIQRALLETNVHEEGQDNITLNRKRKELLLTYRDCLMGKGNYKSLLNSAAFFEYGDLLAIKEYWKQGDQLWAEDIKQMLTHDVEYWLTTFAKTTYIGLYLAQDLVVRDGNGVEYDNDTNMPITEKLQGSARALQIAHLDGLTRIWGMQDLMLKMALVDNFFATYFMPIHLDLLHCTVENVVYSECIRLVNYGEMFREDVVGSCSAVRCHVQPRYYLGNVSTIVSPWTTNAASQRNYPADDISEVEYDNPLVYGVEDTEKAGFGFVHEYDNLTPTEEQQLKNVANQYYNGTGVMVPFEFTIENVRTGSRLVNCTFAIERNGEQHIYESRYINATAIDGKYTFAINLLFTRAGAYRIGFRFDADDGLVFVRWFAFDVMDDGAMGAQVSRVVRCSREELDNVFATLPTETMVDTSNIPNFMFTMLPNDNEQHMFANSAVVGNGGIGLTNVIMIPADSEAQANQIFDYIQNNISQDICNRYWWFIQTRDTEIEYDGHTTNTNETKYYVTGISKYFDNNFILSRNIFDESSLNPRIYCDPTALQQITKSIVFSNNGNPQTININIMSMPYFEIGMNRTSGVIIMIENIRDIELDIVTINGTEYILENYDFVVYNGTRYDAIVIEDESSYEFVNFNIEFNIVVNGRNYNISHTFTQYMLPINERFGMSSLELSLDDFGGDPEQRLVNSFYTFHRFWPLLHKLEPIADNVVTTEDVVCVQPVWNYVAADDARVTRWEFTNETTQQTSVPTLTDTSEAFVSAEPYSPTPLERGYYSIALHYKIGTEEDAAERVRDINCAFRVV